MAKMQSLLFEKYGPPDVLSVSETEVPIASVDEAVIRVAAAALNPSDVKNVAGAFKAQLPRIPGRDFAGVVVSGEGWVGKEVWGSGAGFGITRDGAHAQFARVPIAWLSEKPKRLSMEQAATVGIPFIAAWSALVSAAQIKSGETVLITGSSGAVGNAATAIASWKGARVIGADRSDSKSNIDHHINTTRQDLAVEVKALTGGAGVDIVLDTVGGPLFEPSLRSLRQGGRQIAITSVGSRRVEFDLIDFFHNSQHLIGVDTMKLSGAEIALIMDELRPGFESGHLRALQSKALPLDKAVAAYEAVAAGTTREKLVFLPHAARGDGNAS